MIIKDFRISVRGAGPAMNLYCIGDLHIGSPAFLGSAFDHVCDIVKSDPLAYFICPGDLTDEDRPSTRLLRHQMFNDRQEAFEQEDLQHLHWLDTKVLPKLLRLIKPERCLGLLDGDHYRKYATGLTSVQYMCAKHKIPYLGGGQALLRLTFCDSTRHSRLIKVHVHHGKGGGVTEQSDIRELQSVQHQWPGVRLFIRGHSHKPKVFPFSWYEDYGTNPPIVHTQEGLLVNCGSFRQGIIMGQTDYAEKKVYSPTSRRCPVVHFTVTRKSFPKVFEVELSNSMTVPL